MSSAKERFSLSLAQAEAHHIVQSMRHAVEKVHVVGSVRREVETVGDLELLVRPNRKDIVGIFGIEENYDFQSLRDWAEELGTVEGKGRRYFKIIPTAPFQVPIDVFVCTPPATWGVLEAIRTGPADYMKAIMASIQGTGLECRKGLLFRDGEPIPCPTEREFFEAVKWPFLEPTQRHL